MGLLLLVHPLEVFRPLFTALGGEEAISVQLLGRTVNSFLAEQIRQSTAK